jgi:serine/threonine protein kinase
MEPIVLNSRYRLLELIGSGGMAVVYKCEDVLLGRQVAVKLLRESFAGDPSFLARFQREARAAAQLDHPNIVTIYDVGQDGERHYIVMEFVDGRDLKSLIREDGRVGVDQVLLIASQIASGVAHAHDAGVVHCDIKPQNVLVTWDWRAMVTDFGIARALSESGLTEAETVWGSPMYFSPEQASGTATSPASDVYSIGVVVYEMLTGSPPFRADSAPALALKHINEDAPRFSDRGVFVPPQLEWIIRKMMAKEPALRYRTAGQVAHVLDEYRKRSEQSTGWQPASAPKAIASSGRVRRDKETPLDAESASVSDRVTWTLAVLAFVAVVGLMPLWWLVYRSWLSVGPPSFPTATLSLPSSATPGQGTVPDVLDLSAAEARRLVEAAGFSFAVLEQRDASDSGEMFVVEQTPGPDALARSGSEVTVVLGGRVRELEFPDFVGYQLESVRGGIEADGLRIQSEEVWSPRPTGTILLQEPLSGSTVRTGDTVTLTVSGGLEAAIPLGVTLVDTVLLKSAELSDSVFAPGDVVDLTLHWEALQPTERRYVVFVHVLDPTERLVAQQDVPPAISSTEWIPGTEVADSHPVLIPKDAVAGRLQLRVGLYPDGEPGHRLKVTDPGLATVVSDSILIAQIEVKS